MRLSFMGPPLVQPDRQSIVPPANLRLHEAPNFGIHKPAADQSDQSQSELPLPSGVAVDEGLKR
jgi:hypothetical protein